MIVLQLVAMLTKAQEWAVVQLIDRKTSEHTIVLASHSTKLDAILDFGFNAETNKQMKEQHDRSNP
jgi:hypothetical protein